MSLQPHLVLMRRIIIAETDRFPDLARTWYASGPVRAGAILPPGRHRERGEHDCQVRLDAVADSVEDRPVVLAVAAVLVGCFVAAVGLAAGLSGGMTVLAALAAAGGALVKLNSWVE
jgi:AefR-like transcriptional repressor, C-terminal domain